MVSDSKCDCDDGDCQTCHPKARHTPGPWAYHKWGRSSGTSFGIETANRHHGLASITPNVNASTLLTMEQHEANARLIAAAPDLLAACEHFFEVFFDLDADEPCGSDALDRAIVASWKIRAAISKAKGGA